MPTDGGIYTEPAQLLAELTRARTAAKFALLDLVDRYQINVARLGAEIAMKQRGKPCRMHGVIILARYQRKFKRYSPSRLIEIITAGAKQRVDIKAPIDRHYLAPLIIRYRMQ